MSDPGGPDRTLAFGYDDSPAEGPEITPYRLKWPHPLRRLGNVLVFLAAADPQLIGSRTERHRYITVALLMFATTIQAFYAATLFFAVSLNKSFRREYVYGLFFAAAVYLIDRSIISYPAPIKVDKAGNLAPPKKTSAVLAIRVGIALVAAILMSEMILLQVFRGDISLQIQNNHLAMTKVTDSQIEANYQKRISALQNQIDAAQAVVTQRQRDVNNVYQALNCQEFGCPAQGIVGGFGPGYAAAKVNWENAVQSLGTAKTQLQSIRNADLPQIRKLTTGEQQAIANAQPAITNADKVMSQEEAFWQLTVQNGTVLVMRVLLSLLLLGIDLAPILAKLTGRTSLHDIRAHSSDYRAREKNTQEVTTAVHQYARQGDVDRRVHDIEMDNTLFEAQQRADVVRTNVQRQADVARAEADAKADAELYRIKLEASLSKLKHHRDYMAKKPVPPGGQPGDDNAGWADDTDIGTQPSAPHRVEPAADPGVGSEPVAFDYRAPVNVDQTLVDPVADQYDADAAVLSHDDPFTPAAASDATDLVPHLADPAGSDELSLDDEVAEILFTPEEPSGMLVLDHKWVLHGRLPEADDGGGGIVWRAQNRLGDVREWFVVKTVPSGLVDRRTTEYIQQIGRTAQYIQQLGLRHEERASEVVSAHVGEIIDHGDDRGFSYLVYPLYRPGSLATYCRWIGDRRTLAWCAQVIDEVLSGLIAASAVGLVHLDIKPGNIVLDGDHARVIDWGLSRVWNASQPSTWIVRGTPFYACPEQLIRPDEGWDTPRADLYGVGATFYWLLTGEAPLQHDAREGHDLVEYRKLHLDGVRPQQVHELVTGIPRSLSVLIDNWLSFDPDRRVPPGTSMADSLRVARDQLSALRPLLHDMTVGRVTARRRRRRN
jgi:hypothetical protein